MYPTSAAALFDDSGGGGGLNIIKDHSPAIEGHRQGISVE